LPQARLGGTMPAMKNTLPALIFLVFTISLLVAGAQENTAVNSSEQAVLGLEQHWEDALTKSDTSALSGLYDDTLIYTHSNGKVDTKASYIKSIESGATRYLSMKRDDIKVTVYDKSAVVTCHWQVRVAPRGGNTTDMNARYLHVYVRQADGWKLVAHESTRIAQ
jgi:ketosteroid isomerase-like protein